jgi:outer membrane beta-barrel protein
MNKKLTNLLLLGVLSLTALLSPLSFAAEDDLYDFLWLDPDKKVYVLQNKVYEKQGSVYINVGFIKNNTSDFQSTTGAHLSAGYYFSEEWAIEACYNQYNNSDNDAVKNVRNVVGLTPFIRKPNKSYGASIVWSPFYGKINTFNKIIYLDWSFGLGVGQIQTESNSETVSNAARADVFNDETYTAIKTKTALRIHISEMFHVNIEYQRDNYRAPGPKVGGNASTKWRNNSDAILSLGISF